MINDISNIEFNILRILYVKRLQQKHVRDLISDVLTFSLKDFFEWIAFPIS